MRSKKIDLGTYKCFQKKSHTYVKVDPNTVTNAFIAVPKCHLHSAKPFTSFRWNKAKLRLRKTMPWGPQKDCSWRKNISSRYGADRSPKACSKYALHSFGSTITNFFEEWDPSYITKPIKNHHGVHGFELDLIRAAVLFRKKTVCKYDRSTIDISKLEKCCKSCKLPESLTATRRATK